MGKVPPNKIAAENEEDQSFVYDDEKISGHMASLSSDDNAAEPLAYVIGNKPKQNFNIGEEINHDEQSLTTKPDSTVDPAQPAGKLSEIDPEVINANAAGVSENLIESTEDPFEALTDADLKPAKKAP